MSIDRAKVLLAGFEMKFSETRYDMDFYKVDAGFCHASIGFDHSSHEVIQIVYKYNGLIEAQTAGMPPPSDEDLRKKPVIVRTIIGTITEVQKPTAGLHITIRGRDGHEEYAGVEQGEIVGTTAEKLKIGDEVRVDFIILSKGTPPVLGPARTVLLRSAPTNKGEGESAHFERAHEFDPYQEIHLGMSPQQISSVLQDRALGNNTISVADTPSIKGANPLACENYADFPGQTQCVSHVYGNPLAEIINLNFYHNRLFYIHSQCHGNICSILPALYTKRAGTKAQVRSDGRLIWHVGVDAILITQNSGWDDIEQFNWRLAPPGTEPQ
jgi:hypothetical protein